MRKLVIFVVIVFALGALFYLVNQLRRGNEALPEALNVVPTNAALIIEARNLGALSNQIQSTSIVWKDLQEATTFQLIDVVLENLDTLTQGNPELNQLISGRTILVSAHPSGKNDFSFLFTTTLPPTSKAEELRNAIIKSLGKVAKFSSRTYDGHEVTSVQITPEHSFHFAFPEEIFVASFSPLLLEEAIRQTRGIHVAQDDAELESLRQISSVSADANLYVNFQFFQQILQGSLTDEAKKVGFFKSPLANRAAFDVYLKPNTVTLSGYSSINDSVGNFLETFSNQAPRTNTLAEYMPGNTAYFVWYGWQDTERMLYQYQEFLEKQNRLFAYTRKIEALQDSCSCNLNELLLSWVSGEVAVAITEPSQPDYSQNKLIFLGTNNPEQARVHLDSLNKIFNKQQLDTLSYRGFSIGTIRQKDLYQSLLTDAFTEFNELYYTVLDQVVVLANSPLTMRVYVNTFLSRNTLGSNEGYEAFADNLARESNLIVYSSLARSPFIYQHLLNEGSAKDLAEKTELLRKFEAASFQFAYHKKNLFLSHVHLKHNPIYKKESTSLFELSLQQPALNGPWIVKNHVNSTSDIIIQDAGYTVYQIGNTGEIDWKLTLEEPILGEVNQVDLFKNNKLQLVFSTATALHVVDRTGKYVSPYPVTLPSSAAAPMAVFDYDNNRDYRFLTPLQSGQLYLCASNGKLLSDWKNVRTAGLAVDQPQHLRLGTKDYIFVCDDTGEMYLLDRRGNKRYSPKAKAVGIDRSSVTVTPGNSIEYSIVHYTDTAGIAREVHLDGSDNVLDFLVGEDSPRYLFRDLTGDARREILSLTHSKFKVANDAGSVLFEEEVESGLSRGPYYFKWADTQVCGYVDLKNELFYLYNQKGKLWPGMPLYGSTAPALGDINNDGQIDVVIGNKTGQLYVYGLDQSQ